MFDIRRWNTQVHPPDRCLAMTIKNLLKIGGYNDQR